MTEFEAVLTPFTIKLTAEPSTNRLTWVPMLPLDNVSFNDLVSYKGVVYSMSLNVSLNVAAMPALLICTRLAIVSRPGANTVGAPCTKRPGCFFWYENGFTKGS